MSANFITGVNGDHVFFLKRKQWSETIEQQSYMCVCICVCPHEQSKLGPVGFLLLRYKPQCDVATMPLLASYH